MCIRDSVELVRNGDWLSPLGMDEVLRLTAVSTVARMLERDDFHNRYKKNETISMLGLRQGNNRSGSTDVRLLVPLQGGSEGKTLIFALVNRRERARISRSLIGVA